MKGKRKIKKITRLNLIPIMDAVFIFIFFLLMSAQFLEIREISSDAPSVSEVEVEKIKKEPLNLVLDIQDKTINVLTGLDAKKVKSFPLKDDKFDLKSLHTFLMELKREHIEEQTVVLKPSTTVPYEKIVEVMDTVRSTTKESGPVMGKNEKGEFIQTNVLFSSIVFDAII